MENSFRHKFRSDLKTFFVYNKTERLWQSPVLAALALGIPLLIGYFTNELRLSGMASFGGLVILHYTPVQSLKKRMLVLFGCSFGITGSFLLGTLFNFSETASVIFTGIFSFMVYVVVKLIGLRAPGNFFFIAIAVIGCSLPQNQHTPLALVFSVAAGTAIACFLAFIYGMFFQPQRLFTDQTNVNRKGIRQILIEGSITSTFLALSMLTGFLLGAEKSYWIPLSCLAVMQGITRQHVFQRMVHRIAGTFIGVGLCWLILKIDTSPLMVIFMIMTFQFIVETFVSRNYGLAVIFVTPMTILMAEIGNPSLANPDALALIRLEDIAVGSVIGALGGWLIHNEQLKNSAIRTIRKGRVLLKRNVHF